jgi:hypothetical protein
LHNVNQAHYEVEVLYAMKKAPKGSPAGAFLVVSYKLDQKHNWLFKGTLEPVKE